MNNSVQTDGNIKAYVEEKYKYSIRFSANGILHDGKACLTYMVQNESVFGYEIITISDLADWILSSKWRRPYTFASFLQ
jgi:hypothetical protein